MKIVASSKNSTLKGEKDEPQTEWNSMWIAGTVIFFTGVQFTVYYNSLWPYLQQLDSSSTETQFGYIMAAYSIGQAVTAPLFGYMSNVMGSCKPPVMTGLVLMNVGGFLYYLVPYLPFSPQYSLMFSRLLTGMGAGIISVLRTYAAQGSTAQDRSKAISTIIGGFSLGLTLGPAFQMAFTPLGYPGVSAFGLRLNMYTCSPLVSVMVNTFSMVVFHWFFVESKVGIHQAEETQNEEHSRFYALASYDKVAVAVCMITRFLQLFVIVNQDTLGSPMSMIMFNWDRQTTIYWHSLKSAGFGVIGIIMFGSNIIWNVGQKLNHRKAVMFSIVLLFVYHLVTFAWWGMPGKIPYQEDFILVNGTRMVNPEPTGCKRSFEWCNDVAPLNVYIYFAAYILIIGIAFPVTNISLNVVYSTIIGPRNQGTMTGLLMLFGSLGQLAAPLFLAPIFEAYGPRIPWIVVTVSCILVLLLWIIFYRRMVPLKMYDELTAGDSYRTKHGKVMRF